MFIIPEVVLCHEISTYVYTSQLPDDDQPQKAKEYEEPQQST